MTLVHIDCHNIVTYNITFVVFNLNLSYLVFVRYLIDLTKLKERFSSIIILSVFSIKYPLYLNIFHWIFCI